MRRQTSRLTRLEEKRNIRKAALLVTGTAVVAILGITIGVKVLARIAGFSNTLGSAGQPIDKNDNIPPGPPLLLIDFDATSSARMTVNGTSEPGSTIFLLNNKESVGNVVTMEDGSFVFSSVTLNDGENSFVAVAVDQAGNKSNESGEVKVYFSTIVPSLSLETPTDRQIFTGKDNNILTIKGKSDPGIRVNVNGRVLIVNQEGEFSGLYNLNEGENNLIITATSKTGSQIRKELMVEYRP